MTKRLVLKKDALGELSTGDLRSVVGGAITLDQCPVTGIYPTLPVKQCLGPFIQDTLLCK